MKALITGITGFLGSHLAEHLLSISGSEKDKIELFGTAREFDNLENLSGIKDTITFIEGWDIRHAGSCDRAIEVAEPDYIFHLVSQRPWPEAKYPLAEIEINTLDTARLLEAVNRSHLHPVIVIMGCGEMYGCPPQVLPYPSTIGTEALQINSVPESKLVVKLPITEDFPLNPVSTYAVSKAAQDMLGFQYHKEYGMKIVRARAFDITGPRCHQSLLPSNLAKQMVEIEKGRPNHEIKVASLEYSRDYTDVRDVARALWLAATKCKYGEAYNICSGMGRTVQQVIDMLRLQSTAQFEVVQDKTFMHANDIPVLVGSGMKFYRRTGWKPEIGFAQSMGDLLEWWRRKAWLLQ